MRYSLINSKFNDYFIELISFSDNAYALDKISLIDSVVNVPLLISSKYYLVIS